MSDTKEKTQSSLTKLSHLPNDLPFSDSQQHWLSGFFSGLHSKLLVQQENQITTNQIETAKAELNIIYGTQTGNCEQLAEQAAQQAEQLGMLPIIHDMDDIEVEQLATFERLFIICSTYGEGEMPDNAQTLWQQFEQQTDLNLSSMFYSVLALGDTSYDEFCLAGKLWDERLQQLGAQRINERVDCDVDFSDLADQWITTSLEQIKDKGTLTTATVTSSSKKTKKPQAKFTKQSPLQATLLEKRCLNHQDSSKEIYHYEFSLEQSGESYQVGDALHIVPQNSQSLVDAIVTQLDLTDKGETEALTIDNELLQQLEIRTPSKDLLQFLSEKSSDSPLTQLLNQDDKTALNDYLWGKDSLDLLRLHEDIKLSADEFIGLCKPLNARAYSISSSENLHNDQVHVTISNVRYENPDRQYNGVCSTFLADEIEVGEKVACYFSSNKHFTVPQDDQASMIMVGPGTGIAPFRAFLQERQARQAKGKNWLFFGDRNEKNDFIYQQEIQQWQQTNLLTKLDLAFSRDQEQKIYVQHKMLQQGAELFSWLEAGAYFYVCGDAYYMAKDVEAALCSVIKEHGQLNDEQTAQYLQALKKDKRYVRDVY